MTPTHHLRWGAHLDLSLVYSNMWSNLQHFFTPGSAKYVMQVRHSPVHEGVRTIRSRSSSPYLTWDAAPPDSELRVVRRSYGIRVHYQQMGLFAAFNMESLLAFIASSAALLSIPWTISEMYVSFVPDRTTSDVIVHPHQD
uniref:Uncharacterized protein n=1 Tax=Eutreptiella gymnastica TaxID=73025 RepID=A0A7S1IFM8_9EUGL|mmetsp:Transcript_153709/g.268856  ORF Transcript_153709/g.268856 Transcript_153709/m.268856 type:complete len:141 (+) Transcript_153709:3-425(+)